MEMGKNFPMNGGSGDASYANNSRLQETGIRMTKDIIEDSISNLCHKIKFSETLRVVDLGCSSGPNTLMVASIIIKTVARISLNMGRKSPEIQINLNDLHSNDFNTLFMSIQEFQENSITKKILDGQPPLSYYFTAVPGSFYGRLFPLKSIHFFHCSYCLNWLSQLPDVGKFDKASIPTRESVARAYYEQFQKDFMAFMRCRSEEIVDGGNMIFYLSGRTDDAPSLEERTDQRLLNKLLLEMSFEGHVDEEKVHSFRLPIYTPSAVEIQDMVEKEGTFAINLVRVSNVKLASWRESKYENDASQSKEMNEVGGVGHSVTMGIRAAMEPVMINHFGEEIVDKIFMRFEKILTETMSKQEIEPLSTIIIRLIKKRDFYVFV